MFLIVIVYVVFFEPYVTLIVFVKLLFVYSDAAGVMFIVESSVSVNVAISKSITSVLVEAYVTVNFPPSALNVSPCSNVSVGDVVTAMLLTSSFIVISNEVS